MAGNDWEEIYATYTAEELDEEIVWLKAESRSLYISQSQGSKSFTTSLSDLKARLNAATRTKELKAGRNPGSVDKVVADFS